MLNFMIAAVFKHFYLIFINIIIIHIVKYFYYYYYYFFIYFTIVVKVIDSWRKVICTISFRDYFS